MNSTKANVRPSSSKSFMAPAWIASRRTPLLLWQSSSTDQQNAFMRKKVCGEKQILCATVAKTHSHGSAPGKAIGKMPMIMAGKNAPNTWKIKQVRCIGGTNHRMKSANRPFPSPDQARPQMGVRTKN
eukprot:CAMPEP_0175329426 /NCGR_PEP_ID=MMETSP0095-20121207/191_1 /TAXON_ID=311494 /ORGANISM="Alexandrium monilatum, Strain CCMP3105" /LENGTH=127 /DNA_ID=CAMNT_0016626553 /DNA_START=159 /DNA_END=539 /DNA_ORIENTATION=+